MHKLTLCDLFDVCMTFGYVLPNCYEFWYVGISYVYSFDQMWNRMLTFWWPLVDFQQIVMKFGMYLWFICTNLNIFINGPLLTFVNLMVTFGDFSTHWYDIFYVGIIYAYKFDWVSKLIFSDLFFIKYGNWPLVIFFDLKWEYVTKGQFIYVVKFVYINYIHT